MGQGGAENLRCFLLSLSSEAFKAWKESLSARGVEGKAWNSPSTFLFKKMMWISAPRPPHSRVERGGTATRWGQGNRGVMCQPQARWDNRFGAQSCQPAQAQALPSLEPLGLRASARKGLGGMRREKAGRINRVGCLTCGWGGPLEGTTQGMVDIFSLFRVQSVPSNFTSTLPLFPRIATRTGDAKH